MGTVASNKPRRQAHIVDFEEARSASRAVHAQRSGRGRYPYETLDEPRRARDAAHEDGRERPSRPSGSARRSSRSVSRRGASAGSHAQARGRVSDDDLRRSARIALEARMEASGDDRASSGRNGTRGRRRSSVSDAIEKRSGESRKRKADRMFDRQIGDDAAPSEEGPRAAVYRGKMGRSHKRSARMQNERAGAAANAFGRAADRLFQSRPRIFAPVAVVVCAALICAFLYAPAKMYYTSVRDEAKAAAQLDALQQRNDELQQRADALSTDAGVEDEARNDYGWVSDGENAVHVSGLSSDSSSQAADPSADSASNVTAPDTWYSGVLDQVFGYVK